VTDSSAEPAGPGQALFQFVRHWARRWSHPSDRERSERGRDVLVVEAVCALRGRDEVTVSDVAAELAVDQSGASRMLSHAVDQGFLATSPSPTDARRRVISLTSAGLALLEAAHQWQEEVFGALTEDWTTAERAQFHHAMARLLARSSSLTSKR